MTIPCQTCNQPFSIAPSRVGIRKTCSRTCSKSIIQAGDTPWNKGIAGDPRVLAIGMKGGATKAGRPLKHDRQFRKGDRPWNFGSHVKFGGHTGLRKDRNPNWKGGVSYIGQALRRTVAYAEWRTTVLKANDYTCQLCGSRGGNLIVDHYPYAFAKFPEHRLDPNNGRTLCADCNWQVTYVIKEWKTCPIQAGV